ncbi:MAG: outer membrane beta-barrel protein [Planctomycetaceae bacterium]
MEIRTISRTSARTAKAGLLLSGIGLLLVSPAFGQDTNTYAPAATAPCAPAANSCCATPGCDGTYSDSACPEEEPWTLMSALCGEEESPFKVAGWLEFGYQSDHDGAFTGNGPFLDDHEWKSFNLNQMYLYSEKVADGTCGWDWGYRADFLYGVDGNEGQAFGNPPGEWDFLNGYDHGIYEWAIPQLYAEVAYDKLSVKLGHFFTPTGYDVFQPSGNFFFSHQILWYNAEPFTHTGALATYKATDNTSVSAGWVAGWDTGFDQFQGGSQGLVVLTQKLSENTTLVYFNLFGDSGWRGDNNVCQGAILTQTWTEKFSTVHQFDVMGSEGAFDFATTGVVGDSVGFENYAFYQINDTLKAGARLEWLKADGVTYYTITGGVNIKVSENLLIRPEVKHLWAPGVPGGAAGTIASNVADVYGNSTVFGIDAVLSF